jgi:hypothetical protein
MAAARICCEHIWPAKRATYPDFDLGVPSDAPLTQQADSIVKAALDGEIPVDVAGAMIGLILDRLKVEEVSVLEQRITALEQSIGAK